MDVLTVIALAAFAVGRESGPTEEPLVASAKHTWGKEYFRIGYKQGGSFFFARPLFRETRFLQADLVPWKVLGLVLFEEVSGVAEKTETKVKQYEFNNCCLPTLSFFPKLPPRLRVAPGWIWACPSGIGPRGADIFRVPLEELGRYDKARIDKRMRSIRKASKDGRMGVDALGFFPIARLETEIYYDHLRMVEGDEFRENQGYPEPVPTIVIDFLPVDEDGYLLFVMNINKRSLTGRSTKTFKRIGGPARSFERIEVWERK